MHAPCDLVLVGPRPGALHAAAHLGLSVLLVDDRPTTRTARRRGWPQVHAALDRDEAALVERVQARLAGGRPRGVFACGERGVRAAACLREAFDVPGTRPGLAERARDKAAMKAAVRAAGVPCADWHVLGPDTTVAQVAASVGLPAVLKLRAGSGSRGTHVLHTWEEARRRLAALPPPERGDWMVERFVHGEEMSVESFVVGGRVLLANPTEYFIPTCANIAPAHLEPAVWRSILALNERALGALGVERGMTHLELFRSASGCVFGEVAVRPPGGRIMRLLRRAYDFDPWQALLQIELGETPRLPSEARAVAGVWMIHPGSGTVRALEGLDEARRVRGVRKLVCRLRLGDAVPPRASTGNDTGWIEVGGRSRDEVAERLCLARQHIRIHLDAVEGDGLKGRV